MEVIIDFFAGLSSVQKLIWIVLCLAVAWMAEGVYPLFRHDYSKWKHARTNLVLLGFVMLINVIFAAFTVGVSEWTLAHSFGILNWLSMPLWLGLIITFLVFDLVAQYFVHFLLHKIPFMWRFHMVHHSDEHVDATTGTRHHPGDYLIRECFALLALAITGAPFAFYLLYRITTVAITYYTHANIKLPSRLDAVLSTLFITPNMHKFHHHFERPWTDSNYGQIFSIWDRLFGTFVNGDTQHIKYGLDVLEGRETSTVMGQLKVPFDKTIKTD